MVEAIDRKNTSDWLITVLAAGSFSGGHYIACDLVNKETRRAHRLDFIGAGISGSGIGGSLNFGESAIAYATFTTSRPVQFADFKGLGARISVVDLVVYSISWLTIYDGSAYSDVLAEVKIDGWAPTLPGATIGAHGVLKLVWGDGQPYSKNAYLKTFAPNLSHIIPEDSSPKKERGGGMEDPIRR